MLDSNTWKHLTVCKQKKLVRLKILTQNLFVDKSIIFQAGKEKKQKIPYTNYNRCWLANAPAQVETLLHSLEQTVGGIFLDVNADKTEYMCFNKSGGPLKLVDKFTYIGSSVSSSEKISTRD